MALTQLLSPHGTAVINFYNLVSKAEKNGRMRDAIGITVDPDDLIRNVQGLLDAGARPIDMHEVVHGRNLSNTFSLMACDGFTLPQHFIDFSREKGVPLSSSMASSLVGVNRPSWTNQIEIVLEEALAIAQGRVELKIDGFDQTFAFADATSGIQLRNTLKDLVVGQKRDGGEFVGELCVALSRATDELIEPTLESNDVFDRKMTWDQVRELRDAGHTIISHGASHTSLLTNLKDQEVLNDVGQARSDFFRNAGVEPWILTYPEGAHNENVQGLIQDAGIKAAFTMKEGIVTEGTDVLAMPRFNATQAMLEMPEAGM